jgi:hypothetical protein
MVAMSPRQPRGAVNDNDPQHRIGPTVERWKHQGGIPSLHSKRSANGLTGRAIAAIALVTGILALPLLWSLEVPAAPIWTTSELPPPLLGNSSGCLV